MHTVTEAQAFGDKLAARLGENWKVDVWENIGWHTAVWLDGTGLTVHISHGYGMRPTTFSAFLNEPSRDGHRPVGGIWATHGDTPEEAISNVLAIARAEVARKQTAITVATDALEASRKATWEVKVAT
jgi:hypothetical protein